MQLYDRQKTFSLGFVPFIESSWNFKHFRKKEDCDSWYISEITECQTFCRPLYKKRRFRTSFGSQRVNGCQALVKSAWDHFYHILWLLWREMTWKITPLWKLEILGVFVNILVADDKYPNRDCENLKFYKCNYLENKIFFLNFFSIYGIFIKFSTLSKKKMIVIANVFLKLETVKTWLNHSLESAVWEPPSTVSVLMGDKHLWNLDESTFIIFFDHSEGKWLEKYLPY